MKDSRGQDIALGDKFIYYSDRYGMVEATVVSQRSWLSWQDKPQHTLTITFTGTRYGRTKKVTTWLQDSARKTLKL